MSMFQPRRVKMFQSLPMFLSHKNSASGSQGKKGECHIYFHSIIFWILFYLINRKVCQTLVSTKPKVVVERIPKTVCPHDQPLAAKSPSIPKISPVISPVVQKKPGPKFVKSPDLKKPISHSHNHPHRIDDELLQSAGSYPQKVYLETDHVDVGDVTNPVYDEYPEFPEPKQIPESAYKYPQGTYKNQEIPIFEVGIFQQFNTMQFF